MPGACRRLDLDWLVQGYSVRGDRPYFLSLTSGRLLTWSAVRVSRMSGPVFANDPSGMATTRPPNPRKPPVLTWSAATLPLGPVFTARTSPILLPSEEKTLRPTRSWPAGDSDGGAACGLCGPGPGSGAVAGGFSPGGVGAGDCWAAAERVASNSIAAAPSAPWSFNRGIGTLPSSRGG